VKLLLENGADVNDKDNDGSTALSLAKKYGRWNIVELLSNAGAVEAGK
jgi:ankyrin repeat protein